MSNSNPLSAAEARPTELFPIREVARQTGINPVTLRAWERRYGLIQPQRSAKGHRLYSQAQINDIRKVLGWLERGVAVSQVKPLLEDATESLSSQDSPWQAQQEQWLSWIEQLAERKLDTGFKQATALYPPETLCQHLLLPLLSALQKRWTVTAGTAVEQVFFMTWLRTQLASRISQNNRLHNSAPLLIVGLSSQLMQPGLWLCGWLASYFECPVQVLESAISAPDLSLAVSQIKPRAVILYGDQRLKPKQLQELLAAVPSPLLLAGQATRIHQAELLELPQLTCATDPLHTLQQLLQLNILSSPKE